MKKVLKKRKNGNLDFVELYNIECTNAEGNTQCSVTPPPSNGWVSCTVIPAIKSWIKK